MTQYHSAMEGTRHLWTFGPPLTWAFGMAAHSPAEPMGLWAYLIAGAFTFTSVIFLLRAGPHLGWALVQAFMALGFLTLVLIVIALVERLAVPSSTPLSITLGRLGFHALCFFALFLQPHDLVRRGRIAQLASTPPTNTAA
jgi:hypothetical protein